MNSFEAFAKEMLPSIEKKLFSLLSQVKNKELRKAASYAFMRGKKLRPLLTLATVSSFCPSSLKKAYIPALSLEMIHTYSLIHDDLPCMDNDDFRRGRKALHKAFPEWLALLCGDFLLTFAFEVIASDKSLSSQEKTDLSLALAKSCGGNGMIAGQIEDMSFQGKTLNENQLKRIHEKKTGCLFVASIEFGSLLCHLPLSFQKRLTSFGKACGFAYQILDDLEDRSDTSEISAATLLGPKEAKKKANALLQKAKDLLLGSPKADLLLSFVDLLQEKL
jgi:geranylgeranyl diphosphate synthase, type II